VESEFIQDQIRRYTRLLDETIQQRRTTQRTYDALQQYAATHRRKTNMVEQHVEQQRRRLATTGIDPRRVRVYAGLAEELHTTQQRLSIHFQQRYDQAAMITAVLRRKEAQVEDLKRQERRHETMLADLHNQLVVARTRENTYV
jgi:outer membrane scaffolding protein for murein synthesis (MipA/OmpV family)